jgi:hypothetical protein
MAIASLLTLVKRFTDRTALPEPTTVIGNPDPDFLQIMHLLEETCDELSSEFPWEWLVNEATWAATNTEDQGSIETLAPNGFRYMVKDTFWNRTQRLPIIGPLQAPDWQSIKAIIVTGPRFQWRFRGHRLLMNPAPPAGHNLFFEYVTKNYVAINGGTTYQDFFSNDADTVLLPDKLVLAGLRWRWKKEKKLAYAEDMDTYTMMLADAKTRDKAGRIVHMDDHYGDLIPGIWVPPGSWPLH